MTERAKKIAFASGFVVISIGMGYAIYWMLFRPQPSPQAPEVPAGYEGQLPGAGGAGGLPTAPPAPPGELPPSAAIPGGEAAAGGPEHTKLLRDSVTQAVSASPDGSGARFYNPDDGRFYRVSPDGSVRALGDKQFFNVQSVNWANTKDQTVLEFPDGSNVFYDFNEKRQVTLPPQWEGFQFSTTDEQLAAKSIGIDPDNRFLIVSNPDGSEARAIEALGENADLVHADWSPAGQIVAYALTGEPMGGQNQQVLFVGQNREKFKSLTAPGQGFLPSWSPTGKQILYSAWSPDSDNKPLLWISSGETNSMGADRRSLKLNTWADKCVWASETELYCGVPRDLPQNAGVLREQFVTLPDDVYRVDLTLGSAVKVTTPDQAYAIRQPVLSGDKKKFLFTDAASGKMYSYDLP